MKRTLGVLLTLAVLALSLNGVISGAVAQDADATPTVDPAMVEASPITEEDCTGITEYARILVTLGAGLAAARSGLPSGLVSEWTDEVYTKFIAALTWAIERLTGATPPEAAQKLNEYAMVSWFGEEFGAHLQGLRRLWVYMLVAAIYCYVHYFFASATAHISALFPLSLALMIAAGIPAFTGAVALGVLSNINGCLTQYGIGSGPVMYGAGYVTQGEWWKAGFLMSLIYMVVWLVIGPLWWMALGHV